MIIFPLPRNPVFPNLFSSLYISSPAKIQTNFVFFFRLALLGYDENCPCEILPFKPSPKEWQGGHWKTYIPSENVYLCKHENKKSRNISWLKKKTKIHLVGGFNPFEKYARQIRSFPQGFGVKIHKNLWVATTQSSTPSVQQLPAHSTTLPRGSCDTVQQSQWPGDGSLGNTSWWPLGWLQ